ncbi:putative F-box protein At5g55150 [Salvia miltiorrhiza]|uniref:putative F-box protein At5g55150 n=1 Tax=Salvia miltiorrhiza TaxID=226208 RepID=UPI0025AC0618|nr:putative F-box protein At5g55150 [Salvia miltiorrhiza]XP_057785378.1 putative F-box protein At5g55150 [Salvia miltiorrhiza]
MADWSRLPYDIIHKVSTYITAIEDFLAFSAVCCSWRSVYLAKQWQLGPQIPMLMFSDYENSGFRSFISLCRNRVYSTELPEVRGRRCWGSSSGWIVTIGDDLQIHLLNPFTRVSICLPSKSSLQIQFSEILDWHDIIQKVFVFRNPFNSGVNEEGLLVLIIYSPLNQLAFCRPGYSSWKNIRDTNDAGFIDAACLGDRIYAIRDLGSLIAIDIESLAVVNITGQHHPRHVSLSLLPRWDWERLFLVESSGELWIVLQRHKSINSIEFLIYSFDFVKKKWIRLSSLGNSAVFVDSSCSVVTGASEFLNCKSNCVYFVGTRNEERWQNREIHVGLGVYSLEKGVSEPLCFGTDAPRCYSFPLWVTPTMS